MKVCSICKIEKDSNLFKKEKRSIDGYSNQCKECARIKGLEYYYRTKDIRKEDINKNRIKSYQNNKEIENSRCKKYKIQNKKSIKEYNKKYNKENKDVKKEYNREYNSKNKEKIRENRRIYIKERLRDDIIFRISHYCRNMIRKSFRRGGYKKESKTYEILGCSFEEFKLYLESKFEDWMTWGNRGLYNGKLKYGWDIDHIIPVSSAETEEDIIKLNHYTNLQPLCSKINRDIKRDSI